MQPEQLRGGNSTAAHGSSHGTDSDCTNTPYLQIIL
jgi:hypothetical protein